MSSLGTGLLAAFGGATENIGKVMGDQAREKKKETVEAAKAKALEEKQKNLLFLQNELSGQRQDKQNEFTVEQQKMQNEFAASNQAKQNEFKMSQTQMNADLGLRNAKSLAGFNASLKTQSPTDIEKKYNFLAKTIGEEKAKELITSSMVKTNKGDTALDYRKLWQKTYKDTLDSLSEDINDTRPFAEKESDAKRMADTVSGVPLGGSSDKGNLFDQYHAAVNQGAVKPKTSQQPQPQPQEQEQTSGQTQSTGILSGAASNSQQLPIDPRTWNVQFMGHGKDRPFITIGNKIRPLSPDEYEAYKKATSRMSSLKELFKGMGAKTEIQ